MSIFEEEPPPPRSTPGEHTGDMAAILAFLLQYNNLGKCTVSAFTLLHSLFASGRSTVVGHALMVHTCSFMCTNNIDITVHTLAFLQVGGHSHHLDIHHSSRGWQASGSW